MSDRATGIRGFVSPWYWGYATQGLVVIGALPILLPLVAGRVSAAAAGIVVAAFYAGQLTSPLWGGLAERSGRFAACFLSGFLLLAISLILFPLPELVTAGGRGSGGLPGALLTGQGTVVFWSVLAFVQGAGAGASNTVSGMIIVETTARETWDGRIGWLQTFYGAGQTLGLALASALQAAPVWGILICAALMVPGYFLGRPGLPPDRAPATPSPHRRRHRHILPLAGRPRGPRGHANLAHYADGLRHAVPRFLRLITHPFGVFIAGWFLVMSGSWLIYNLYPLLMRESYGTSAMLSSLYFAAGALIGAFLYAPSGAWAARRGDVWVLLAGCVLSLLSLLGMSALLGAPEAVRFHAVPFLFVLMPIAWSPLIVSGTAITGALAPIPEGEAMGVFNAATALASVLGALGAGAIATVVGYNAIVLIATGLVGLSCLVILPLTGQGNPARASNDTA